MASATGFYATFNPQQDSFGNVTNSSYQYWQNSTAATTFSATYQNNRVTSITDNGLAQTWNYDAMGNRTSIVKTSDGTTLETISINAMGVGVAAGATLDGEGQTASFQGNYYIRSAVFGGEIVTTVDSAGSKTSGRVLDGGSLLAEQIKFSDGTTTVRWHHRDPLNLVARDAEPGQVKRRVHAVTPNGAQIETSEGVNLTTYYACLLGGNNNPTCTGYNPQAAAAYGYLANQANGLLGGGIKVDGALTSKSFNDIMRQGERINARGSYNAYISPALSDTPITQGIAGSFVRRAVLGWREAGTITSKGRYEKDYTSEMVDVLEWVGSEGIGAGFGLTGGQELGKQNPANLSDPLLVKDSAGRLCRPSEIIKDAVVLWNKESFGGSSTYPHTFIQSPKGSFGYYPSSKLGGLAGITAAEFSLGEMADDSNLLNKNDYKIAASYSACPESVTALIRTVDKNKTGFYAIVGSSILVPQFGGMRAYNCTTWACQMLKNAGFSPPSSPFWPILLPSSISK